MNKLEEKQYLRYKSLRYDIDYFGYMANFFFGIFLIAFLFNSFRALIVTLICMFLIFYYMVVMIDLYLRNKKLMKKIKGGINNEAL